MKMNPKKMSPSVNPTPCPKFLETLWSTMTEMTMFTSGMK
jgi:hypothetical protein